MTDKEYEQISRRLFYSGRKEPIIKFVTSRIMCNKLRPNHGRYVKVNTLKEQDLLYGIKRATPTPRRAPVLDAS